MTNNPANGYPATGYPAPGFQGGPATMTSQQLAQEDQVHNEKQAQGERKRAAMWVKATSALAVIAAIVYAAIKLWTFVPWVVDGRRHPRAACASPPGPQAPGYAPANRATTRSYHRTSAKH